MSVPNPYAAAGITYLKRGVGGPIPLPPRAKKPPLEGWTGYDAPYPSGADVTEWANNGHGKGNIALRLAEEVIGIDVDAYGSKPGAETLAEAEERLGKLPDGPISTSRPLPSGIRLFRVPAGRCWADVVGPGVEVIHWGHRYCVVAPSIHPDTGEAYFWIMPDGRRIPGPALADVPLLTQPWIAELDRGPVSERSLKASVDDAAVSEMLSEFPAGAPCPWLNRVLSDAASELRDAVSRHDTGRHWVAVVVRAGEQGHIGASEALGQLWSVWKASLEHGESRKPDAGEWDRMVAGAVAIVTESPTAEDDRGCCGSPGSDVDLSFDPGESLDSFWSERPILTHIRQYAQAHMVSPWAVLGVVLARASCRSRPTIKLPKLVGSYGSLNLFVALVGSSGVGKGTAEAAAGDCIDFGESIYTSTVGSGEGLSHLFTRRLVKERTTEQFRDRVLLTVSEVDTITGLGQRMGATLLPELRKAWSGERLGFQNADPARTVQTAAHTYRLGLVLGVQPGQAGPLLSDAYGGTPQRFLWLPAFDRHMPAVKPADPGTWGWTPYLEPVITGPHGVVMDVPSEAAAMIEESRRAAMALEPGLDGHSLYCRLKVAAALALLDSRLHVYDEDWELAGRIMVVSDATRAGVQEHLAQLARDKNRARAVAQAEAADIVDETREEKRVSRVAKVVLRALARAREGGEGSVTFGELNRAVASRDREWLESALEKIVASGEVSVEEMGDVRRFRMG